MEKDDALNIILHRNGDPHDVKDACKLLIPIVDSEGLTAEEIHDIIEIICSEKLRTSIVSDLFRVLIPEYKVEEKSILRLLSWIFTKEHIHTVERHCFRWLSAVLRYGLCDKDAFQLYYHSLLFILLEKNYLGSTIFPIVYELTGPEDVKPWLVRELLVHRQKNSSLPWDCLLSRIKLYRSDAVPGKLRTTKLKVEFRDLSCGLLKAQERYKRSTSLEASAIDLDWRAFCRNEKKLHLIPAVEFMRRQSGAAALRPLKALSEFKNLKSMSMSYTKLEIPKQAMSLLTNQGGFFFLAFSEVDVQTRFLLNLDSTLTSVLLMDIEDHSDDEKLLLLISLVDLQKCLQQNINVINKFLVKYLRIWDGIAFNQQIFQLLEWFIFENFEDWETASTVLRLIFRYGSMEDRCLLIRALSGLVNNIAINSLRSKHDVLPPLMQTIQNTVEDKDVFIAIGNFVEGIALEVIPHEEPSRRRRLLSEFLDFYHKVNSIEDLTDAPVLVIIPATVVYPCLFSNSRYLMERLCSLLMKYSTTSRHRLNILGVYSDFEDLFEHMIGAYIADCYRALFSNLGLPNPNLSPGIFSGMLFDKLKEFIKPGNGNIEECLRVDNCPVWWTVKDKGVASINEEQLKKYYPHILKLKQFVDCHLDDISTTT